MDQSAKAATLRRLHLEPQILVLPNAWDVASAKKLAAIPGCRALATTSAAVARSLGWEDGEQAPVEEMLRANERIYDRDEVLHAARLQPFRKRASLAPEEVDELYAGMRTTLTHAIDVLRERVPPTFETQVRDFLAVHMKGGQPCPRCGTRITEVKAGGFVTSYCRGCQR